MRQLAALPLVGSWLEAIPHVPARVQNMTLTTFHAQAHVEQRSNLSPNDFAKTKNCTTQSLVFIFYKPQPDMVSTQQRRHNCGVGRGRETTSSPTASWLMAGGNPPRACASPKQGLHYFPCTSQTRATIQSICNVEQRPYPKKKRLSKQETHFDSPTYLRISRNTLL